MKLYTNKYTSLLAILVFSLSLYNKSSAQFPSWGAVGSGTNGVVNSIIEFNNNLIVAGSFTTPGRNIAKYNGSAWSSLGTGTNDTIFDLAIYNNKLIAVGSFDSAGGVICNRIAEWDGATWSPLGLGANNTIHSVDSAGTYLRIGGRFTTAGGVNCSRVARWQGSSWSAMGLGVNGNVYALEQFGNELIIGGAFTMAGAVTANRIVRFNLTSGAYTALGTGIDSNSVYALSAFQDNIYVGGNFTTIGGITVNRFARWTGTNWFAIGNGINGTVKTLDSLGPYFMGIGGSFTSADGVSANNIVGYGGSSFGPFGSGLTGGTPSVNAIIGWRGITVAAGLFTNPPSNIARWGLLPGAPELILPLEGATGLSVTPTFTWAQYAGMYAFRIQVARDANFLNIVSGDSNLTLPQFQVSASTPLLDNTIYFWRVQASNGFGNGPYSLIRFFTTGFVGIVNNNEIPEKFKLYQNFPNPFNPVTKIKFDLPLIYGNANLKLSVYNINGEKVAELLNTDYTAGKWEMDFDGKNLASGVYLYKIEAGPYVQTNKMILIK